MRIFLDTNIFLDILIAREDRTLTETSAAVLSILRQMDAEICLAAISVPTIAYVIKNKTASQKKHVLKTLLRGITICTSSDRHVHEALDGPFDDIEDAMQYACARDHQCDLIITRDTKGFKHAEIDTMTAKAFLEAFEKSS